MRFLSLCLLVILSHSTHARISQEKCNAYEDLSYLPKVCTSLLPIHLADDSDCKRSLSCERSTPLIVGGEVAGLHEFPHFALLGFEFGADDLRFLCGGSLISENFVITAAHCRSTNNINVSIVRLGESNLSPFEPKNRHVADYRIEKFIRHPNYNASSLVNDIALIKIATNAKLSNFVRPACLHTNKAEVLKGKTAIAIGFGAIEYGGDSSEKLLKVNLTVVQHSSCSSYKSEGVPRKIEKSQLCVKGEKKGSVFKDSCQGDSGGPLQFISEKNRCMYTIFGIVSFGHLCGFDIPSVYTRISSYIPWIEENVWG